MGAASEASPQDSLRSLAQAAPTGIPEVLMRAGRQREQAEQGNRQPRGRGHGVLLKTPPH